MTDTRKLELDLSGLSRLAMEDFRQATEGQGRPGEGKPTTERENAPQGRERATAGATALQREADQHRAEREQALKVLQTYQENTNAVAQAKTDILKGLKAGAGIYGLFLKAVEAVAQLTADTVFSEQARADLAAIYGAGLLELEPLQTELQGVITRHTKLTQALQRPGETQETYSRIKAAIQAHEARAQELVDLINKAYPLGDQQIEETP